MTERKRKHRFKAEPVGVVDPSPNRSQEFATTDDERLFARAHLRTQQAFLGKVTPRAACLTVFGAALLCVEAGIEVSKALMPSRPSTNGCRRSSTSWGRRG